VPQHAEHFESSRDELLVVKHKDAAETGRAAARARETFPDGRRGATLTRGIEVERARPGWRHRNDRPWCSAMMLCGWKDPGRAGALGFGGEERLEDAAAQLRRPRRTAVLHQNQQRGGSSSGGDFSGCAAAARRTGLEGIVEELMINCDLVGSAAVDGRRGQSMKNSMPAGRGRTAQIGQR